jgi:hypothetical protein
MSFTSELVTFLWFQGIYTAKHRTTGDWMRMLRPTLAINIRRRSLSLCCLVQIQSLWSADPTSKKSYKAKSKFRNPEKETSRTPLDCSAVHVRFVLKRSSGRMMVTLNTLGARNNFQSRSQKLRKATISFVMSVLLSIRMEQLGSHSKNFHEIWYLNIFPKSVEKIQVSLKSDNNNRYFTWRPMYIYDSNSLNSS